MNPEKFVGTVATRVVTFVFLLLSLALVFAYQRDQFAEHRSLVFVLAVVACLVTLLGAIHCFHTWYSLWMRFSKVLQTLVISVIFGTCYLLIVPFFSLIAWVLRVKSSRRRAEGGTYWIPRRTAKPDLDWFQRLG